MQMKMGEKNRRGGGGNERNLMKDKIKRKLVKRE